ncbi:hypothetical protein [Streptomyces sp. NPDC058872]|uniref:hypothetical protein n=1 Tax=Streptomyces sp. NPDC058872 TaxID=3346661 RepID=UPI003693C9EF
MSKEETIQDTDAPPPEPSSEQAPPPESEPSSAPASDVASEAVAPVRRPGSRVLRTAGLIAVAAVIGLVGGTAVGYGIQAEREPTPLPALNQQGLAYPAESLPKGQRPAALPAAEDRQTKARGDIRKLLLPVPAGAKKNEHVARDGWMSVSRFAEGFNRPDKALDHQLDLGVRRIATASWTTGAHKQTAVRLIQYRANDVLGAEEYIESQRHYMPDDDYAGNAGKPLKGSANGHYYVFPVQREAGYLDLYEARAYFYRGDIAVAIFVIDTKKVSEKEIRSLAERQLERL